MTAFPVRMEAERVVKHYTAPEMADRAQQHAEALAQADVATPLPLRLAPDILAFPRLEGRSGAVLASDLPALLAPLPALHAARVPGLAPLDPFRRIFPRLAAAPPALRARIAVLAAQPRPRPTSTVHGDFHPGQVIMAGDRTAWLIDLDDLALATPEADLGNLLAWLLTSPSTRSAPPAKGWKAALLAAWTGPAPDCANLGLETEIALIRRALKCAERGDDLPLQSLLSGGFDAAFSAG